MQNITKQSVFVVGLLVIAFALFLRLLTLSQVGLLDPSEGRYAVMAKDMYESSNWITPVTRDGSLIVPFLAKPPLFVWLTALSLSLFGVGELAARLPSFLAAIVTCASIGFFGLVFFGREVGVLAMLALLSSMLFFLLSGTCVIDPLLACCSAVCMTSFAVLADGRCGTKLNTAMGYGFFLFLALGVLTKGPLALILAGAPIGVWLVLTKGWSSLRKLPWLRGTIILTLLVVPWFLLAEAANPGFLQYFLIQENLMRYFFHHYGDLYGTGHSHPYGYIWFALVIAFLPWSPLSAVLIMQNRNSLLKQGNRWVLYLSLWVLLPILFFTLTRQVTLNYVLPALPALSLLTALYVSRSLRGYRGHWVQRYFRVNLIVSLALLAVASILGLALGIHWLWTVLSLCALLLLFGAARKSKSISSQLNVEVSMLSTVMLLAIGTVNVRPWLDANLSAKDLASYLEAKHELENEPEHFGFFFKVPHSFYFYSDDDDSSEEISGDVYVPPSAVNFEPLTIIRKSDIGRLKGPVVRIREQVGAWAIVENL